MKYDKLCEMNVEELLGSLMGQGNAINSDTCTVQQPIQPTNNVGEFGNANDIKIKVADDGGLEVDSKDMAIKLSSTVFNAIKSFIDKGE